MKPITNLFKHLDSGDATRYVDQRLFRDSIDTLENHIQRKIAIAEVTRYTILYLLYEYGEMSRKRLSEETGRTSNKLQQPLRKLLDVNLIERIPGPEEADQRKTYYRITTLGRQEIENDIRNIIGGSAADAYYEILVDADLVKYANPEAGRLRHTDDLTVDESIKDIQAKQDGLKRQFAEYERAAQTGD